MAGQALPHHRTDSRDRNDPDAHRQDIFLQFLTEVVVLSLKGGLVGIAFRIADSRKISSVVDWLATASF
jgi:hypothetical protein